MQVCGEQKRCSSWPRKRDTSNSIWDVEYESQRYLRILGHRKGYERMISLGNKIQERLDIESKSSRVLITERRDNGHVMKA